MMSTFYLNQGDPYFSNILICTHLISHKKIENPLSINGYLSYKTNYFESFTAFRHVNNYIHNKYVNIICCNIRSVNFNFDELTLFLENDPNSDKIDVIVLTETWHNF